MLTKEEQKKFTTMLLGDGHDIQDLCDSIVRKYETQASRMAKLEEENHQLMAKVWEKEEMRRMKEEHDKMKEDYYRGFPISEEEEKKIKEFKDKYKGQNFGAIGGAFTYQFTPTSIGVSGRIIGPDGKEFEFSKIR